MKHTIKWISVVLLSIGALSAGIPKLFATPTVVAAMGSMGYSQGFTVMLGLFWVLGAIGLYLDRTRSLAALGILAILAGAIGTHTALGHGLGLKILLFVVLALIILLTNRFFEKVIN